jgi:hypothetical protein
MAATSATLVYTVAPVGVLQATPLSVLLGNVIIDDTVTMLLEMYGVTLTSDTTGVALGGAQRTIVFGLGAEFNKYFPDGTDQTSPFQNLFTHQFGQALGSKVLQSVVIA